MGLRGWRAPGGWSRYRRSRQLKGISFGGSVRQEKGIQEPCFVLASGENSDTGSVSHILFHYFVIDETDGLVRPSSPRAHKCQGKLNLNLLMTMQSCAYQIHRLLVVM